MKRLTVFATLVAIGLCACASGTGFADAAGQEAEMRIFLVRHAERADDDPNPGLTDAGQERALALADEIAARLGDAPLTAVYSTPYRRTLETAAPTAERHALTVTQYDPSDLAGFAETLRAATGAVLVVGHSNTTPELVALLGGDPGDPIDDADEYDRFYEVTIAPGEAARSEMSRYGN
jgi:broad specificity phosphatase PhoE